MSVASQTYAVTVTGDGATTSFPFTGLILPSAVTDLEVWLYDTVAATATKLLQGTGTSKYSVTVASFPGTGSITYPTSGAGKLATTQKLVMKRKLALLQGTILGYESGYSSVVQETTFDYGRYIDLQQQEEIDRSVRVPIGSGIDPYTYMTSIATSLAAAQASQAAAATSATAAATSATASAGSATASAGSATTAAGSATSAATQATAAAASAAAAAASNQAYYDFSFNAGYTSSMTGADIAAQTYGDIVVSRAVTLTGESGYIRTPATGQAAIFDIQKNGTSVYSVKPQFAAAANAITAGTLKTDGTQIFAAGDRMTFLCTQVGSGTKGQQAMFTAAGHL